MAASSKAFLAAVEAGNDDAEVFHCLSNGIPVETRDVGGDTALACAAYNGHLSTCILLLRHGADTNARSSASGDPPLMWAAAAGHCGICELLLANNAQPIAENDSGYTALYRATYKQHARVVRLLLAAGADATMRTSHGKTAMDQANENQDRDCCLALDAFLRQDPIEMERIKLEFPQAAANYIMLPPAHAVGRSTSPTRA
jgi:ankyrin repeat protein